MSNNQIDNINNENGGIINIHNPKTNRNYYLIIIGVFIISGSLYMGIFKDNINNQSTIINDNSGNIKIDNSIKVYNKEKEKKYEIEFLDLLLLFLDNQYTWIEESNNSSKIKWSNKGVEELPFYDFNPDSHNILGQFVRQGKVSILNNGKPSHLILLDKISNVTWTIRLWGPRGYFNIATLFNSSFSRGDGNLIIPPKFIVKKKNFCPNNAYLYMLYQVKIPKHDTNLWILAEEGKMGMKGSLFEYTILFEEPSDTDVVKILKLDPLIKESINECFEEV